MGIFPASLRRWPRPRARLARRAARRPRGALTVADLQDRWWNNYSGTGVGLRGGTWSYSGDATVVFRLHRVSLVPGVRVSGRARWSLSGTRMTVRLRVTGAGPSGRLHGSWDTRRVHARALLTGRLGGKHVRLVLRAP